ncbi:MAG: hypothetical protein KDA99_16340 [Planctomycetales bacterium]|nr:hypothetical protein [Planctomycetales bacterium]
MSCLISADVRAELAIRFSSSGSEQEIQAPVGGNVTISFILEQTTPPNPTAPEHPDLVTDPLNVYAIEATLSNDIAEFDLATTTADSFFRNTTNGTMSPVYQPDSLISNSFVVTPMTLTVYGSTGGPLSLGATGTTILLGEVHLLISPSASAGGSTTLTLSDPSSFADWGAGRSGIAFDGLLFPSSVTITAKQLAGDYNRNGTVDAADYTIWKDSFGSSDDLVADGNENGTIDAADYTVWKDNFGSTMQRVSARFVPEPNAGTLLMMCSLLFMMVRTIHRD